MRELVGKLESSDDPSAVALRIIDHFDRLVEERATVAAVVRAMAALAGCPAGLHDAERGIVRRFDSEGRPLPESEHAASVRAPVPDRIGMWVWLERPDGAAGPLDPLLLERAARTVHALNRSVARTTGTLVRAACDPDTPENDRRNATQALGLTWPVTATATATATGPPATTMGRYVVALARWTPVLPPDLRAGAAVASEREHLPSALERAVTALRLADRIGGPGASVVGRRWHKSRVDGPTCDCVLLELTAHCSSSCGPHGPLAGASGVSTGPLRFRLAGPLSRAGPGAYRRRGARSRQRGAKRIDRRRIASECLSPHDTPGRAGVDQCEGLRNTRRPISS